MSDHQLFQRLAAVTTILAVLCYLSGVVLLLAVMNFSFSVEAFSGAMISTGARGAGLLRWGMIFDVFGSYLLLTPLALHLWAWLKQKSPIHVSLYTLCGLAYILIGSMGAIVLSAVLPPLINHYVQASASQRDNLQVIFNSFLNAVFLGLWNPLEVFLLGIWLIGLGPLIQRERRALGVVTRLLGFSALIDSAGRFLDIQTIFFIGSSGLFLLVPVWLIGWGIDLLRKPVQID
ncbi:MAG TPA: DUF4386 family protein [Anaerolineales bacterium]